MKWEDVIKELNEDLLARRIERAEKRPLSLKEWLGKVSRRRAATPAIKSTEDEWRDLSK